MSGAHTTPAGAGRQLQRHLTRSALAVTTVGAAVLAGVAITANHPTSSPSAPMASTLLRDRSLSDLTGLAASTYDRDVVWALGSQDGGTVVSAIDGGGATVDAVRLDNATNVDWQDIAPGPGHALWVGDIGDPSARRNRVTLYRFREPTDLATASATATRYRLRYADGPHDARALLIDPRTGRAYVATRDAGGGALYAATRHLSTRHGNVLRRVADVPAGITGGSFTRDGDDQVLVGDDRTYLYDSPGTSPATQDLPSSVNPTGVTFARNGSLMVSSAGSRGTIFSIPLPPDGWPTVPIETLPTLPVEPPTSSPSSSTGSPAPTSPTSSPPASNSAPSSPGEMGVGMYNGSFGYERYRSDVGSYPAVDTTYLNADQVTTPNISRHEAQIDHGISPVITLDYKNGPFTRSEIAAWGPRVQSYYQTFVAGLKTLSDYAARADNGTRVYFADEHEAQVKINQDKYSYSAYGSAQTPTTAESAAAWNKVMAYVAKAAPAVVRTYWYGGSGANEDKYAAALDPSLVQMATFDPYRWRHNSPSDTPEKLWGSKVSWLKSQSWMRNPDGTLKPWGLTEWGTDASLGDSANATFVTEAMQYLREQGAAFAVYFNRVDGNDRANDFVIDDGRQPRTLAAFRATAQN